RLSSEDARRAMLTTRGTFIAPGAPEVVAPHVSVVHGVAPSFGHADVAQQYSPLVPLAAVSAAQLMTRVVAPTAPAQMSPGLRAVLATVLERAAVSSETPATRVSLLAPELVTPPAPRAAVEASAERYADEVAAQQAQLLEVQRIAQRTAAREI